MEDETVKCSFYCLKIFPIQISGSPSHWKQSGLSPASPSWLHVTHSFNFSDHRSCSPSDIQAEWSPGPPSLKGLLQLDNVLHSQCSPAGSLVTATTSWLATTSRSRSGSMALRLTWPPGPNDEHPNWAWLQVRPWSTFSWQDSVFLKLLFHSCVDSVLACPHLDILGLFCSNLTRVCFYCLCCFYCVTSVMSLTCQSTAKLPKLEWQRGHDGLVCLWWHLAHRHHQRNHHMESVIWEKSRL